MLGPPTINFAISTIVCIVSDCESNLFAHYVMIYKRVYGEIYDVPRISVHLDACADSVYQALFSGLGMRLGSPQWNTICFKIHKVIAAQSGEVGR